MKKKAFIIAAVMALVLTSCTREEIFPVSMEYGEPVNATLTIGVTPAPETVVTKAASGNAYSALNSLLLVFFDSSYKFKTVLDTASGDLELGSTGTDTESNTYGNSGVQYTASFTIASGTYNVVGIGNYTGVTNWTGSADGSTTFATYLSTVLTDLANGDLTYTQFLDKIFYVSYSSFISQGLTPTFNTDAVLLTGCNSITVPTSEGAATNPDDNTVAGELELYRGVANIEFNITPTYTKVGSGTDNAADADVGNTVTFTPSSYTVYNVPKGIRLNPSNSSEYSTAAGTDVTTSDYYYDTGSNIIGTITSETYTFNFFMPENIQTANSTPSSQAAREAWSGTYDSTTGKKDWTYAPDYATYVVISGSYTESKTDADGNSTLVYRGTVSYTVHLGDFSSANSYDYGNFTVKRNYSYTYNITVRGVDDIITEVETRNNTTPTENSPGAEGSIYAMTDESYYYVLDAHFEQVILSYDLSLIIDAATSTLNANEITTTDKAIGDNIILQIESPFQSGTVTLNPYTIYAEAVDGETGTEATTAAANAKAAALASADYKWIEFWPQADKTIAAYPGVPTWNGGTNNTTTNNSYLMDAYDACVAIGKAVKILMSNGTLTTGTSAACDNIILSDADADGTVDHAYFTGFVNEYYYFENPINGNDITWGDFADKDSRRMVISMNNDVSKDGNSSYNTVRTRIVQRSIQTFYDSEDASTLNGFGIETYNESNLSSDFGATYENYTEYDSNGLKTFNSTFSKNASATLYTDAVPWSDYLTTTGWTSSVTASNGESGRKLDLYQNDGLNSDGTPKAWSACLSRNRDLDGDGNISVNEVYWYLPTVEEYTLIMLGENALSNESRLYFGDKSEMTSSQYPDDYISDGALYYSSSKSNKRIFWAAERASYQEEHQYYGYSDADDWAPSGDENLPLRCARRLPAVLTDYDSEIDPLCTIKQTSDGNYVADLRNTFESSIYRTSRISSGGLTQHNEDDTENKLYYGFVVPIYDADEVVTTDITQTYYGSDYSKAIHGYSGCGYITDSLANIAYSDINICADFYEKADASDKGAWRVPNLSELVIISQNSELNPLGVGTTTDTDGSTYLNLTCRTQFSNTNTRWGYHYYDSDLVCIGHRGVDGKAWSSSDSSWLQGDDEVYYEITYTATFRQGYYTTRCVRDATDAELNATAVTSSE